MFELTRTQVYLFSVAASETFCRLSVGKNWAGEQGGAIEFKGSKPASLILEHVAFLRNIVSKADPAAQYKPVDVVISPSRPANTNLHAAWAALACVRLLVHP